MVMLLSCSIVSSLLCIVYAQYDNCGTSVSALISGGREISKGEYPWLAALYRPDKKGRWEQYCGGALISPRIVITAAHCLVKDRMHIELENIKVGLGKIFRDFYHTEESETISNVTHIIIHNRYNGHFSNNALDIGLLKLSVAVSMSEYILPVCMDLDIMTAIHPGTDVNVAGWGTTENGTSSNQVLAADLSYDDYLNCLKKIHWTYRKFLTLEKCCTISTNGSQVDKSDSGGALTCFRYGRHFVIGVVSTKISGETSFSLFTDLSNPEIHYWLKEEISKLNAPGEYNGLLSITTEQGLYKATARSPSALEVTPLTNKPEVFIQVVDCVTSNMYYYSSSSNAITEKSMNSNRTKIIYRMPDGLFISALAVDWIDQKLYWIEALYKSNSTLRCVNLKKLTFETKLPTIPQRSVKLIVHPTLRKLYVRTIQGTLESVDLDSSKPNTIIFYEAEKDILLQDMDFDWNTNELCWISGRDRKRMSIECKNVVNGTMRTVLSNAHIPWMSRAFAISSHFYYWARGRTMYSLSKFSQTIDRHFYAEEIIYLHYYSDNCPSLTPAPGVSQTNHS